MNQKRFLLWTAYPLCGWVMAFAFGGWGHGSFAPAAIFFSWAYLLANQLGPLAANQDLFLLAAVAFVSIGYPVALCVGLRLFVLRRGRPWYLVAVGVHLTGAILAQSTKGNGHLATQGLVIQSYIWSVAALVLFFLSDYWLVERQIATTAGMKPNQRLQPTARSSDR